MMINFIGLNLESAIEAIKTYREKNIRKTIGQARIFDLTQRFWIWVLEVSDVSSEKMISELGKKEILKIAENLCRKTVEVKGKSTFKEEFVTAGGVELKEIDFKNMSSKILPNFYLAGEVLNIDAVTGGFNFQACWSEAWLIAEDLNSK